VYNEAPFELTVDPDITFAKTNAYESQAPYEDGTFGLYNIIVPRGRDYDDKINRGERLRLEKLRDSVECIIGSLSPDSYIAGGALTSLISGEPLNDIDVFGTAGDRLQSILKSKGYTPVFENGFIANYEIPELKFCTKLQIIKSPITLEDYFKQLDNTANGITIGSRDDAHVFDSLIYDPAAIPLARKRIIRLCNYSYPAQNLSRMLKYIARGWKVEVDSLKNVAIESGKYLSDKPATLETFSLVGVKGA
jgi:hypothetical protein